MLLVCLWPVVSLIEVFFPWAPVRVGGIRLLPLDPIYFFTISQLVVCFLAQPKTTIAVLTEHKHVAIFFGMVILNVILYTPVHGQSAVGEARKFYFIFLFPLLTLVSVKSAEDLRKLLLAVVAMALSVAVVALYRAASAHTIVRILNSEATLILALASFAILLFRINKIVLINGPTDGALVFIFGLFSLASGQRSVWLAIGVGSILLLWLYRHEVAFVVKVFTLAGATLVTVSVAVIAFPEAGAKLTEKFAGIIDPYTDKTASWRIKGWEAHLENIGEINPLFGEGLGGYYSWKLGSNEINFSPHNAYVQMTLKFGLVGLLIYALMLFHFFRKALAARKKLTRGAVRAFLEIGVLCFGAAHGYMVGYASEPIILYFFAIGTTALALHQKAIRDHRPFGLCDAGSNVPISLVLTRRMISKTF